MEIHTYRAASLQEALMLVRHELGPDASILQTREVGGRFFGLLGKRAIEVEASRDAKVVRRLAESEETTSGAKSSKQGQRSHKQSSSKNSSLATMALHDDTGKPSHGAFDLSEDDPSTGAHLLIASNDSAENSTDDYPGAPTGDSAGDELTDRRQSNSRHADSKHTGFRNSDSRHADSKQTDTSLNEAHEARPNQLSPAMFEVFTELLDADVDPDAARWMLQEVAMHCSPGQLSDPWLIKGRLCQLVQQRIHVAGPIELEANQQHVVALVGPTGVGKTTTLAKLAAGFHFDQGLQVGFITLDTFRLGAIEQLQKYAELLGAPCEVVSSPDQMPAALERVAHCNLILIDTAGRSPRDEAQLSVLNEFLRVAEPTQIHLVLSAASSQAHAEMAIDQFRMLEPTHLLLTKLDESSSLGSWYRLLSSDTWPLSYITTGQNVPEDILAASRRRVASLILGQSSHIGSPRMR